MVTGSRARQVSEQEARDFGISADRVCLEIEQIFHDADDDVLRHTVTVDFSGQPYVTRHVPTLRNSRAARRPAFPSRSTGKSSGRVRQPGVEHLILRHGIDYSTVNQPRRALDPW
ncbi:hypothetical protein ACFT1B_15880 [Streptomyces griseoincarnatus]|jgi:hypothetical protein|uniref:UbiC transcription regulator-associated domain-containing protein n=3 Tax=Streptomyces TaxID=1883 RepID=A0ABN3WZH9_9ACTN|nr:MULTISPECIES: hypothetical protein [Streptomyces]MDX3419036.1 hypothetical protein [Streptomyces sp. MD20-1-1]WSB84846.1 hypothetical protein OHA60_14285 [Streptomyces cellulosae]GGP57342.1 hypothetical protein GCM10010265_39060 [Streptomyces griseoincarnatus]WTC18324.1 hypothetical protein OH709_21870 [Streptomyces cellulosae]GGT81671.1 hypothetical protein GCM10010287_65070 [Streptomyces variabilis]